MEALTAPTWFVCVRYDKETKALVRDFVKCETLKLALDTMMPGHVKKGWKVWQECPAKSGVQILGIWEGMPTQYGEGFWKYVMGSKQIYPRARA